MVVSITSSTRLGITTSCYYLMAMHELLFHGLPEYYNYTLRVIVYSETGIHSYPSVIIVVRYL